MGSWTKGLVCYTAVATPAELVQCPGKPVPDVPGSLHARLAPGRGAARCELAA